MQLPVCIRGGRHIAIDENQQARQIEWRGVCAHLANARRPIKDIPGDQPQKCQTDCPDHNAKDPSQHAHSLISSAW